MPKINSVFIALAGTSIVSLVYTLIIVFNPANSFFDAVQAATIFFILFAFPAIFAWGFYLVREKHKILRYLSILFVVLFIIYFLLITLSTAPLYFCHANQIGGGSHCHWFELFHLH